MKSYRTLYGRYSSDRTFDWLFPTPARWRRQAAGQAGTLWLMVAMMLGWISGPEARAQVMHLASAPGKFYVDDKAGAGVVYNYAVYAISNNSAGPLTGLYVVLTNLVPTNRVTLASTDTGVRALGNLAPGQTRLAAFYLRGPSFTGNSQTLLNLTNETHEIRILDGPPGLGTVLAAQTFSFTNIIFVIEAAANKVRIITNLNPYAVLGSEVPLVIGGDTGTIGGENSIAFSPAVLGSWRPDAYEMVGSIVRFTENPTYTNRLYFAPGVPGFTNYTGQSYTNTIYFRAVKVTGTNLPISPFAFVDSGSGTKHTDLDFLTGSGGSNVVIAATNSVAIVSHTVTPASIFAPGGPVTYSVTFTNYAGLPVALDEIVNVLPGGPTNVSYIPGSATFNSAPLEDPAIVGQTLRWALAFPLGAFGSGTLTFQAMAPLPAGDYTNRVTALIGSEQIDTTLDTTDNQPATVVFTVIPVADLAVAKTAAGVVNATAPLTYTLVVSNAGPSPATAITVTDPLPLTATFVSASPGGSLDGTAMVWTNLGPLAAGSSLTLTLTVTAPPEATGLTNVATVSSLIHDSNPGNNQTPPMVTGVNGMADLELQKLAPPVVAPGVNFAYTLVLTNHGPSLASNVTVVDPLAPNLSFVSASHGGVFSGGNVLWTNLGHLPAFSSVSLTLTVTAPLVGGATNTATASSPTSDPYPGNNTPPPAVSVVGNVPPTTVNDFASTPKNSPVTVPVLANDSDDNGDPLTLLAVTQTNGTATISGANVVFTPALDFVGAVVLTYTVTDGQGGTNTGLLTITVTNVNSPPVVVDDVFTVAEDSTNVLVVLGNDSDPDGDGLVVVSVSTTNGTASISGTNVVYTPAADFHGTNTLVYCATDGQVTNCAWVTVVVWPVNDAPVAVGQSVSTAEDTPVGITLVGVDVDGPVTNFTLVSVPGHGTVSGGGAVWTYTPAANYVGGDSFTFRVDDGTLTSAVATVTITVTPVNDAPVAHPDSYLTGQGQPLSVSAPGILANDTDIEGQSLTSVLVGGPAHGSLVLNANGSFTYTPSLYFTGTDSFSYVASDGISNSAPVTVSLSVYPLADVAVYVTGPDVVTPGQTFTNVVTVTNLGPSDASNVLTSVLVPTNGLFVSVTGGAVLTNGSLHWPPLAVLPASTATNFLVMLTAPSTGTLVTIGTATASTADPKPANNTGEGNGTLITLVVSPQFGIRSGSNVFNPQTGLFEQTVVITNTGLSTVAAVRLLVGDLASPAGTPRTNVWLWNAHGTNFDGRRLVQYNAPLDPGQFVTLRLEFYSPTRQPFTNSLEALAVLPAPGTDLSGGVAIDRVFTDLRVPGQPRLVIEWKSVIGARYTVLYFDDGMVTWKPATPSVTATATRTQWYDDGPPKTAVAPFAIPSRVYRVVHNP